MSQVAAAAAAEAPPRGLASRLVGIVFSPGETYASIAARPRAFGAFAVTITLLAAMQVAFLSTDVGKNALLDRQLQSMEAFGMTMTDDMVRRMEGQLAMAPYTTAGSQAVFIPIVGAVIAGLFLGVFNALLDGNATFKQLYAIVAHAGVIVVLQQIFGTPINYARGELGNPASLAVFAPMLDGDGFAAGFLGAVDLFLIWWIVSLAIGVGVLYKRRTGPIAASLLGIYAGIALIIAAVF